MPIARIIFAPIRHTYRGMVCDADVSGRVIRIDPRGSNPARALLHEYLHILNPRWSEYRVYREEGRVWKRLTWRQRAALYKRLGAAHVRGHTWATE